MGRLPECSPKVGATLAITELLAALPAGIPHTLVHLYLSSRLVGFVIGCDVRLTMTP